MPSHTALIERTKDPDRARLPADEAYHLVRVRRVREGGSFTGVDGSGRRYRCRLERDGGAWSARIESPIEEQRESPLEIVLAQALIKKDRFEWVIQKATELGVSRIVPLVTERSELQLDGERLKRRMTRWRKILAEAVKQSGRSVIPDLSEPRGLEQLLEPSDLPFRIALDEAQGTDLRRALRKTVSACLVLVGPEGGWGERDRRILQAAGVVFVRVGPRTLRAETAPVAVLSILQYQLGDF